MILYNSLSRKKEEFTPLVTPHVGMYTCGMTVYDYSHIGHGRKYVGDDILRRILVRRGYDVKHVQNITDVGHLVSDGDDGEDKMEKGARKSGKTVWEVAEFFTKHFYTSMQSLNILTPHIVCKATEHIPEQIALVAKLIEKGAAYDTPEAVYFDISSFSAYGAMFGQKLEDKQVAAREEVHVGDHKKHPADFALWFKRVGRFADHAMHWDSPWGDGFPGWHIECSAMSMKYLGVTFDIHTGGIDHIPVHHPNEIAQSESASGKQFVKHWVHYHHLMVDGAKMSKSLGNFYTIADIQEKGYDPLALRYLYLSTHYRKPMNFTWQALSGAQTALTQLRQQVHAARTGGTGERTQLSNEKLAKVDAFRAAFDEALDNDMNTPQALAVVWEVVKSNVPSGDKYDLIVDFDEILGLSLTDYQEHVSHLVIPTQVEVWAKEREVYRKNQDFAKSDALRKKIQDAGFDIEDSSQGPKVVKKI